MTVQLLGAAVGMVSVAMVGGFQTSALFAENGRQCSARTTTSLFGSATPFVPPTMIISGIIKKMREADAEKNKPLALDSDKEGEAPGIRIGTQAWKWPVIWPFQEELFMPPEDIPNPTGAANPAENMVNMLKGTSSIGAPDEAVPAANGEVVEDKKLDVLKFWEEDKNGVTTNIDVSSAQKLSDHYAFYLRDGMSVVELGAAEESYLPENLKLGAHVGVGASSTAMASNPALTDRIVADLNDVVQGYDVNSDEMRKLAGSCDVVLMANTVDFLTSPREVFRAGWNLLKPGGLMMVPFTSNDAYSDKFQRAQTKMWREMNDDQHMWVIGSFFHFSAGDGWENLKGFDISPEDARKEDSFMARVVNRGASMNMYVVQATKGYRDEAVDAESPEDSFKSKMWILPTLEERDKEMVALRLAQIFKAQGGDDNEKDWSESVKLLPKLYESLVKMDQFAFPIDIQAQLAADLVGDPDFVANDKQIDSMKMGLGLKAPSESFWAPVGTATATMNAKDKVNLLAHIVPRFGTGDGAQEEALAAFANGLAPTMAAIRAKCPAMSEANVQLVGSELLASEILKPGRSSREEFAAWIGALTEEEIREFLDKRISLREEAATEAKSLIAAREKEKEELEAARKKMQEQIDTARKERTMALNPKTGRMEPLQKKRF